MRSRSARISLVIVILATGVLSGCSSPEKELRKAKAAGTVEALDAFIARHPEGALAEEAKDAKERIFFDAAKRANTLEAYDDFMKRYPQGKLRGAAQAAIEEFHFEVANRAGTIEAYEEFLHRFPKSAMVKKASLALDGLLPSGTLLASVKFTSADSESCTIFATVTILHRSDASNVDVPTASPPGTMNCSGTIGPARIEVDSVVRRDPNHTLMQLKSVSTAGWGGCRGMCTVRFDLIGQEQVVTAMFQ
jgi:outer membrane murein-binding lipoprotein Lpp